jgi:hypothetical protein
VHVHPAEPFGVPRHDATRGGDSDEGSGDRVRAVVGRRNGYPRSDASVGRGRGLGERARFRRGRRAEGGFGSELLALPMANGRDAIVPACVFSLFVRRNSAPFQQPDPTNSRCGDATQGPTGG